MLTERPLFADVENGWKVAAPSLMLYLSCCTYVGFLAQLLFWKTQTYGNPAAFHAYHFLPSNCVNCASLAFLWNHAFLTHLCICNNLMESPLGTDDIYLSHLEYSMFFFWGWGCRVSALSQNHSGCLCQNPTLAPLQFSLPSLRCATSYWPSAPSFSSVFHTVVSLHSSAWLASSLLNHELTHLILMSQLATACHVSL